MCYHFLDIRTLFNLQLVLYFETPRYFLLLLFFFGMSFGFIDILCHLNELETLF